MHAHEPVRPSRRALAAGVFRARPGAPALEINAARALAAAVAVGALLALPPGVVKQSEGRILFERESRYQFVQVVERDGVRRLYLNEGIAVHSLYRPETVLTGGEWDAFLAVPALLDHAPRSLAVLGNAGGTIARAY